MRRIFASSSRLTGRSSWRVASKRFFDCAAIQLVSNFQFYLIGFHLILNQFRLFSASFTSFPTRMVIFLWFSVSFRDFNALTDQFLWIYLTIFSLWTPPIGWILFNFCDFHPILVDLEPNLAISSQNWLRFYDFNAFKDQFHKFLGAFCFEICPILLCSLNFVQSWGFSSNGNQFEAFFFCQFRSKSTPIFYDFNTFKDQIYEFSDAFCLEICLFLSSFCNFHPISVNLELIFTIFSQNWLGFFYDFNAFNDQFYEFFGNFNLKFPPFFAIIKKIEFHF